MPAITRKIPAPAGSHVSCASANVRPAHHSEYFLAGRVHDPVLEGT